MSVSDRFTVEEWAALAALPELVATGAARIEADGLLGSLREARAGKKLIAAAASTYPDSPLIAELAQAEAVEPGERVNPERAHAHNLATDETAAAVAVATAYTVNAALAKADPTDAETYRMWVMAIARRVAEASRSEDAKGAKVPVSEAEQKFLVRLADALGA